MTLKILTMKDLILLCVLVFSSSLFSLAQNTVCFDFSPPPGGPGLNLFTKYIDVYGCGIYAESSVSDEKVLHAAAVFAELLDNNEDGTVDDPALLLQLQNNGALMPIFAADNNAAMNTFFNTYEGDGVAAVLWQTEIDPTQTGHWGADATVEEIMHTINGVGHVNVYPEAFNLEPNSSLLSSAMDVARGGQFMSIPNPYPSEAWYHYDDFTCDYKCMAIEYLYWMQVSNMGILDDPQTCNGIANEWEPCSQSLLQTMDLLGYELITDPQYKLPQNAPDGNYCPSGSSGVIINDVKMELKIFPNPVSNDQLIKLASSVEGPILVQLYAVDGELIYQDKHQNNTSINIAKLSSGTYSYTLTAQAEVKNGKIIVQ